jgi:copper chaperone
MVETTLKVEGMTCHHCVQAVTRAIRGVHGVNDVRVDLEAGQAWVEYDAGNASLQRMVDAVAEEGYTAKVAA